MAVNWARAMSACAITVPLSTHSLHRQQAGSSCLSRTRTGVLVFCRIVSCVHSRDISALHVSCRLCVLLQARAPLHKPHPVVPQVRPCHEPAATRLVPRCAW